MLELCPEASIDLNFSLDGLARTHDSIRGVPNNFNRTTAVMAEAARRYRGIRRLRRNVLTVITSENYGEIVAAGGVPARPRGDRRPVFRSGARRGSRPDA